MQRTAKGDAQKLIALPASEKGHRRRRSRNNNLYGQKWTYNYTAYVHFLHIRRTRTKKRFIARLEKEEGANLWRYFCDHVYDLFALSFTLSLFLFPGEDDTNVCSMLLTAFSLALLLVTLPFSLCISVKVV